MVVYRSDSSTWKEDECTYIHSKAIYTYARRVSSILNYGLLVYGHHEFVIESIAMKKYKIVSYIRARQEVQGGYGPEWRGRKVARQSACVFERSSAARTALDQEKTSLVSLSLLSISLSMYRFMYLSSLSLCLSLFVLTYLLHIDFMRRATSSSSSR